MNDKRRAGPLAVVVFGGRNHSPRKEERWRLAQWLQARRPTLVCHGGAAGADAWMSRLAGAMGIDVRVFKADWNAHGKSAGPRRNEQMVQFLKQHLKDGGRVIGVMAPGGRGTADMMSRCEQAGIEVIPLHKVMK